MRYLPLVLLSLSLSLASPAGATEPSMEHVPGALAYVQGMRDFNEGRYFSARHRFLIAAMHGDKVAQFNLGVIYYQGHGIERDPPRGWAWFDLAAERGYPQMVETAADVWDELDEAQRQLATRYREQLAEEFADEIVVPRTARIMQRERNRATGSRVGFIGNLTIYQSDGTTRSGEDFYAAGNWDFQNLVRMETEMFQQLARGRVEIGEIEVIEDEDGR